MYLIRNQRHHNHASYNVTDTADDKASVLSVRIGTPRQWHIKRTGTYYVLVWLQNVLVVLSDDQDHQDTHSGPYPVLESLERASPHSCIPLPMICLRKLSGILFADRA